MIPAAAVFLLGCSTIFGVSPSPMPAFDSTQAPKAAFSPAPDDGLAGLWLVAYSWGCASDSETTWILYADGTFSSPDVNQEGTWSVNGRAFELTYPYSPYAVYAGTVELSGGYIEGTMAGDDGNRGCWHARKKAPAF